MLEFDLLNSCLMEPLTVINFLYFKIYLFIFYIFMPYLCMCRNIHRYIDVWRIYTYMYIYVFVILHHIECTQIYNCNI